MKRIIVGLAAICALALAAIGAAGASAAPTTAWTCIDGGHSGLGTTFSDPDCTTPAAGGTYGHTEAVGNTQLTLTKTENAVLATEIAGAAVELESTGIECMECMAQNGGTEAEMKVSGGFGETENGSLTFTGVIVKGQEAKCFVEQFQAPNTKGVVQTESLTFETTATNAAVIKPKTGTTLAKFKIGTVSGQTCKPAGTITVTGDASGTTSGAILSVNVEKASETLKVGVAKASLKGKATIEAGPTGVANPSEHHPASLT